MISQFFYIPANQKATEEERIKFTQERVAEVNLWLFHAFVREQPGAYRYADIDDSIRWKMLITGDHRVYINRNWWNRSIELFCNEHRCKLVETDLVYLLMLLYRKSGFDVKPVNGSLCISLFAPWNVEGI